MNALSYAVMQSKNPRHSTSETARITLKVDLSLPASGWCPTSWSYVGRPGYADRIAAGGGIGEVRPFALNYDKSFWLNAGDGCDAYWHPIDFLPNTVEIAAASKYTLYALNRDHTLWIGAVLGSNG